MFVLIKMQQASVDSCAEFQIISITYRGTAIFQTENLSYISINIWGHIFETS